MAAVMRLDGQALRPSHGQHHRPAWSNHRPTGKHSRRGEVIRASPSPCTWPAPTHIGDTDANGQRSFLFAVHLHC
ncbi:MAG: hypothetical protein IPN76_16745 [Saprospiraceae bacterium]|nr:hypothetical protein [Saprospiraceae bacterium]